MAWFQTRTGSTGHLAHRSPEVDLRSRHVSNPNGLHRPFSREQVQICRSTDRFQTRTGSTGHLACDWSRVMTTGIDCVSNPNGLHRPFSHELPRKICGHRFVSNPNGLHRPFSQYSTRHGTIAITDVVVSNPNGLHRPFSLWCTPVLKNITTSFKPERAPQAI